MTNHEREVRKLAKRHGWRLCRRGTRYHFARPVWGRVSQGMGDFDTLDEAAHCLKNQIIPNKGKMVMIYTPCGMEIGKRVIY